MRVLKIIYRFSTGLHLDGKRRTTGGKYPKVLPRYKNYFWNRYSRQKRAIIRWIILGMFVGILAGFREDSKFTSFGLLAFLPFAVSAIFRKILNIFTTITRYTDSDGIPDQYRSLRPKYARWVGSLRSRRFRLFPPATTMAADDIARSVRAINAEEGGEPISQVMRPLGELIANEGNPNRGRTRTINRKHGRRAG